MALIFTERWRMRTIMARHASSVGLTMIEGDGGPIGCNMATVACIRRIEVIGVLSKSWRMVAVVATEARALGLAMIKIHRRPVGRCVANSTIIRRLEMVLWLTKCGSMGTIMATKTCGGRNDGVSMRECYSCPRGKVCMACLAVI